MAQKDTITEHAQDTVPRERPDRVALITGATSGIGRATALEFARQGYDVALLARRQAELHAIAKECEEQGVRAVIAVADVTDETAVQKAAEMAIRAFGHIDIWVNNAAVSLFAKFETAPSDEYRRVIETNLFGYIHGARTAIKQFKHQGHGTLINVSSVTAQAPQPYTSAYVASKYAIRGLSASLRMELQLDGLADAIHVTTVMPASVDTNLFQNAANHTDREVVALEPVYDAGYVAKHIVKLAKHPRREAIIGPAGKLMALEYALMPGRYEQKMAAFYDRDHLGEHAEDKTAGNLFAPLIGNTGVAGGWRDRRIRADQLNKMVGVATAGLVALAGAGLMLWRQHRTHPMTGK
ncbi:SDR family NAD(P)-dependent oxidoreductase [Candidatus Saccharibacteria bacterium]|nr:SDR family NAD(P)-dependent oxidoreductase [Candidatus Saccharibacteria bacterium]